MWSVWLRPSRTNRARCPLRSRLHGRPGSARDGRTAGVPDSRLITAQRIVIEVPIAVAKGIGPGGVRPPPSADTATCRQGDDTEHDHRYLPRRETHLMRFDTRSETAKPSSGVNKCRVPDLVEGPITRKDEIHGSTAKVAFRSRRNERCDWRSRHAAIWDPKQQRSSKSLINWASTPRPCARGFARPREDLATPGSCLLSLDDRRSDLPVEPEQFGVHPALGHVACLMHEPFDALERVGVLGRDGRRHTSTLTNRADSPAFRRVSLPRGRRMPGAPPPGSRTVDQVAMPHLGYPETAPPQ